VAQVGARILRRHWAVLLGLATLLVGPAALLTAATSTRFNDVALDILPGVEEGLIDSSLVLTEAELQRLGEAFAVYMLATALAGLLGTIAMLGFSAVVSADYHARAITLGEALRVCLRRGLSALGVVLVTTLIVIGLIVVGVSLVVIAISGLSGGSVEAGGPGAFVALVIAVALIVAVVYVTLRWAMAIPVLAIEDRGWRAGLRRSWHLSGDNVWRILAVFLIAGLATVVLGALVTQVLALIFVDVLAAAFGLDPTITETVALATGSIILAPLAAVFTAVLYFDLRTRRDPPAPISGPDR